MQQASYHVFVFLLHSWILECNSHNCHLCLRTEKKTRQGRDRPPPSIALRRRQGSNPDLLAESEIHCHICFRTEVAISQQPASLANVLVYKIHAPSRLVLYKVHQLYKYMAIRSDSISVLGQRSNYSCSKGTTVVSDHILCGWHSSNNVLFDATFVSASYDFEVPVLRSITDCSTHDTEFQRISW